MCFVDTLQLQMDQQRVELRGALAETEGRAREDTERLEGQVRRKYLLSTSML